MTKTPGRVSVLETTLRDGAQAEGISFSLTDRLKIVEALDDLGVSYIEAGFPASNPKELEFFAKAGGLALKNARLAAFGSTRKKGAAVADDKNAAALLAANTPVVCIVGKSWDYHVTDVLKTTLGENLKMISETVAFLKERGKEVIFDAEHFFQGYAANPAYALDTLRAAADAGADCVCLCDTNGGTFPDEIYEATKKAVETAGVRIGIHCHNDAGMAVANSVIAVMAGAEQVQGALTGFGERCGNAALSSIIPNLQLKRGIACIPPEQLKNLTVTARLINEIANVAMPEREPYVGRSAFAHKGGLHIDAMAKAPGSYEHVDPAAVGNERKFLTSEVAGRSLIISRIQKIDKNITRDSPETEAVTARLKELESKGYQFEAAEASVELIIRKQLGKYKPFFQLVKFKIIGEQPYSDDQSASAVIKVIVDGRTEVTAAEGNGPVNALDKALRKALEVFYPQLREVYLTDYKVRVLDGGAATASTVRVLIESTDGEDSWSTVGVSNDILEASWNALVDSIEYKLIKDIEMRFRAYM